MMTNLTPSLKADLSLIFQELAQDSGGLLDIKLSNLSEWSNDRAIDLDSLCGYIADLCASRQIDYEQLRALVDNLIDSDATTSQLLQQADDLAPELLKELVLQASIASTELDKMQDEAGGNKTVHWIANHPIESAGIGVGVAVVGGGLRYGIPYIMRRLAQREENAEQHVVEGVDHVNDQLREHVNHEVEHVTENQIELDRAALDKCLREESSTKLRSLLVAEINNKLHKGLEISHDEEYFKKADWMPCDESYLCAAAHFKAWPDEKLRLYKEVGGPLARQLHPRMYLTALKRWEREEKRKARNVVSNKESEDREMIGHDRSEILHLENQKILVVEERSVRIETDKLINSETPAFFNDFTDPFERYEIPRFDKDKAIKAEAEIAERDQSVIDEFEGSKHFSDFLDDNRGNFRDFDFDGFTQITIDNEIGEYYLLANKQNGVIKLEEGIWDRCKTSDIDEVKAIRQKYRQNMLKRDKLFDTDAYKRIVSNTFTKIDDDGNAVANVDRPGKIFQDNENINRWLASQDEQFKFRGLAPAQDWAKVNIDRKLVHVNRAVDHRLRKGFNDLQEKAHSTLNELSNKADEDMNDAERKLKNMALNDLKRSEMLSTYFSHEFESMWKKVESEAAGLLDEGEQDAVDLVQATDRKVERVVDNAVDSI
jgi:hypothetical protein